MALDASGTRHVTWWNSNLKSDYRRVTAEGKIEADPACREMCEPVLKSNAFGWVLCYSESRGVDRAQAWTGDRWTPPLEMPDEGGTLNDHADSGAKRRHLRLSDQLGQDVYP